MFVVGQTFSKEVTIAAASQFLGTEFSAFPPGMKPNQRLRAKELYLKMGSESKTWQVVKKWRNGAGTLQTSIIRQNTGTETDVILTGADLDISLRAGEQVQIVTTSATAAMNAQIVYEVEDDSPTRRINDPKLQR